MVSDITVRLLSVDETYDLRRDVLRDGRRDVSVHIPEDDLPSAEHFGAVDGYGAVVATASFYPALCSYRPEAVRPSQLRFMAVAAGHQGAGLGHRVLRVAVDHLRAHDVTLLWANARDTALRFYVREGFTVIEGSEFVHEEVGIAHTVVVLSL